MRLATAIAGVLLAAFGGLQVPSAPAAPASAPLPERDAFMARVRAAIKIDTDLQQDFLYRERRRDVRISALGKISVGPPRTFEVFPSSDPSHTYKRLVEIDGKRLDPAELARRDAEHARDLDEQARKEREESPQQRARRLERSEAERGDRLAILRDALAVYEGTVAGRETLEGEAAIVVTLTPRPDVRVSTRQGNWMKQFTGRAWFVERDAQFAGLDMQATDDVSIGWGIVGRLHKGSRLIVQRRPVNGLWLPARLTFTATGKTLMFRPFSLNVTTEYFEYRKK